ncbi:MAG: RuBisCO large subunit C-terminal-like domain-containing protein, partial [Betaproteobacteria bacterium]|nr:RuBisCO large subunit C-terminal-like domain-containing protein [Betaproteobacteria bacterium]
MSARLLATYRVAVPAGEIEARARALAAEQSVEMPVEAIHDPRVLDEVVATVESVRPAGSAFDVTLGLAAETTGNEASQLVNMLFGNSSLHPEVELLDVAFPPGYASAFPGPAFGIAGLRERAGVPSRALTCTALKPQGSTVEHLARLAGTFARAGVDVIKDDHGLANQAFSPFSARVPAVQRAIDAANR